MAFRKPTEIIKEFKKLLDEYKTLQRSEIFRRIYKLPQKIPLSFDKTIQTPTIENLKNNENGLTIDDANFMYLRWNEGLKIFTSDIFKNFLDSFEQQIIQENPEVIYSDWEEYERAEKDKEYSDALIEYDQLDMFYIATPQEIELEYQKNLEELDKAHNTRAGIIKCVFNGNGGRFNSFLKNRYKESYLKPSELRKLDRYCNDYLDGEDWHHIIDSMGDQETNETYTKRKKELNRIKRSKLDEYNENQKKKAFLKAIIDKKKRGKKMNKFEAYKFFFNQVFDDYHEEDNTIIFQINEKFNNPDLEEKLKKFGWKTGKIWNIPIGIKMELESWLLLFLGVSALRIDLRASKK